jgi:hypothetical protein
MGIQPDLSTVAPENQARWKSKTFQEWIRQLQNGVMMDNSDEGGGDIHLSPQQKAEQLARGQGQAQRLLNNRLVFDQLSSDQQEFVRRVATREGTQVTITEAQGVQLPAGETMHQRQRVRENVISSLSTPGPRGGSSPVAGKLVEQIIKANLDPGSVSPADQQGLEEVFAMVRDRGRAPDATPQMQTAWNNLETAINQGLTEHEAETEQRFVASGSPVTPDLMAAERSRSDAVKSRLGL